MRHDYMRLRAKTWCTDGSGRQCEPGAYLMVHRTAAQALVASGKAEYAPLVQPSMAPPEIKVVQPVTKEEPAAHTMTKAQLLAELKSLGVSGFSNANRKLELVEAVVDARGE